MRRTTTKKLRNSPGANNEGRVHGSERNVQNPGSPRISPFVSKALGGHVRTASGRSANTAGFDGNFHTTGILTTAPSPYRSTPAKPGRAERDQQNPYRHAEKPAAHPVQSAPENVQAQTAVAKAVPSLSVPIAASAEPAPASPTEQRRELYKGGAFRDAADKLPAQSMRDLMTADPDERPASPRQAEFLANQRKRNAPDNRRVQALVLKMQKTKEKSHVEQQLDAVLEFLNREACLKTTGLHRLCARQSEVKQAVQSFKSGEIVVPGDAHVASALLKELFKQTFNNEESLIPRSLQFGLLMIRKQAIANRGDPIEPVLNFFKWFMPARNMEAYRKILAHLVLVAQHSEINKMDVENLAKLFAGWFYEAAGETDLLLQLEYAATFKKVMELLIEEQMQAKN